MNAVSHLPAAWLDVTRTLTRIGWGAATGIDRVEVEYLRAFLDAGCNRFLCRTTRGYLLLDRIGAERLLELAEGKRPLGRADWMSRLTFRGNRPRHRAEADLRSLAIDRCRYKALFCMIERNGGAGCTYVNVGHSNLTEGTLSAFGTLGRCVVMIHDLIPITHPDLVADTQPQNFAGRIARVRKHASHVIANSQATADDLAEHWADETRIPEVFVAHLGVAEIEAMPTPRDPLHFVMLGTIEPRKNHAMIVDVWEALAKEYPPESLPQLHIIGRPGWKVDDLMARLEAHPLLGTAIHLHGALPDAEMRAHLASAKALLFPSITEGYGFPPLEAAMAGAVPVCSDLPVFRETVGECAVYVNNSTAYHWKETLEQLIAGSIALPDLTKVKRPTWKEHFEIVAKALNSQDGRGRS
ncbi:glycosyltransferase [Rhodobacterales bacterium HKCCE4037]|nr:glycosyltransferase [Rhodobacterales bacterium HKCCE4037]